MNREALTAETVVTMGTFSEHRKTALTRISDFTVPPGVPYQTPEGLRAEDEETRVAFDVQGGVYPIRESVFRASYERASAPQETPPGLRAALLAEIDEWRRLQANARALDSEADQGYVAGLGHAIFAAEELAALRAGAEPNRLDALRELSEAATPGPWFYDSYSGVHSLPVSRAYDEADELIPPDAADDDPRWAALPETRVATVEVSKGDSATPRGQADARFIVAMETVRPGAAVEPRSATGGADVRWRCRLFGHDWRDTNYPEVMYEGVADWAGTKHCRRCPAFRYWTPKETAAWFNGRAR